MTWIELGNPYPAKQPDWYEPFTWVTGREITLPRPSNLPQVSISSVISSRRTRRSFASVSIEHLSTLLWMSFRCQREDTSGFGPPLEWRPVPSAGALHPVNVLVSLLDDPFLWLYNSRSHSLLEIENSEYILTGLRDEICDVLLPEQATLIILAAEPGKTLAKYVNGCSLVWRDAGVILGHMAIAAEALCLNYCSLGITGEPWVNQLDAHGKLVGVGLALLGTRQ